MVFPEMLKPGDTIGLAAPALPVNREKRDAGASLLESMVYKVAMGDCLKNLYNFHEYLAGGAKERAEDLNRLFGDPEVKAIFCARGGCGSAHILKYLDYETIRANPKIFVGYSDITNLHAVFNQICGLVTFHGPMLATEMVPEFDAYSRESLFAAMGMKPGEKLEFHNPDSKPGIRMLRPGSAVGQLTGGNLSLVIGGLGTFYQLDTRGKILFLEDVEESIPRLDMYFTHLENAGLMDGVAGIALGEFYKCSNERYDASYDLETFLHDRFAGYKVPVMYHVASDHSNPMGTLPMGAICRIDGERERLEFYREA